jgi:hypothetical protein
MIINFEYTQLNFEKMGQFHDKLKNAGYDIVGLGFTSIPNTIYVDFNIVPDQASIDQIQLWLDQHDDTDYLPTETNKVVQEWQSMPTSTKTILETITLVESDIAAITNLAEAKQLLNKYLPKLTTIINYMMQKETGYL